MLLKAEKWICMNKQDLRVSANNLESIVLQSEHLLCALSLSRCSWRCGFVRSVARGGRKLQSAVKSIVRSHKIPLAGSV